MISRAECCCSHFQKVGGVLHNLAPLAAHHLRRRSEFPLSRPCLQEPLQCSWTKESLWSQRHGLTFVISSALQRSLTIQAISPWLSQFRVTARIHFRKANHFPRSKSRCGASDLRSEIQLSSTPGVHNQTGWCHPATIDGNLECLKKIKNTAKKKVPWRGILQWGDNKTSAARDKNPCAAGSVSVGASQTADYNPPTLEYFLFLIKYVR